MSEPGAGPITVLAVDDQPANLRLLDAVLAPRGYVVRTARSGPEALETAVQRSIDSGLTYVESAGNNNADACSKVPARIPDPVAIRLLMVGGHR